MKRIKVVTCLTLALASYGVLAEESGKDKTPGSGPNPYVDCGIGAALFPNTHWAAVTSNTIWDAGSTALTSATASPETCNGKDVEAAAFILDTYENLVEETAKGKGEHVVALMNIMEVEQGQREALVLDIRSKMADEVAKPEYEGLNRVEKATVYYQILDAAVANS